MTNVTLAKEELSLEEKLDRFAEVAVHVGLGLQPGQELVMTAPLRGSAARKTHHGAGLSCRSLTGDDPL